MRYKDSCTRTMDKFEIIDGKGVIADANNEEEAKELFEDIRNRRGTYKNFEIVGKIKLVKVIET